MAAGNDRDAQQRDEDTIEDLLPREDESADLKAGFNWSGGVGDPLHRESKS